MITHNKFVLASSSLSRFKILKNSGLTFIRKKPTCNEEDIKKKLKSKGLKPSLIAKKLSYEKAKSISLQQKYNSYTVLGCDTLIYLNNRVFDKAKNLKEAKKKILELSGKKHKIVSGITACRSGRKVWQCSETTEVEIRMLSSTQVDFYLKKTGRQILGSVGCYQIESLGPNIIRDIKGDFFNVMGIPLFKMLNFLEKHQ